MKLVATWLTPLPSTSTRTTVSTRRTFITFGYSPVDKGPHRRRHLQPRRALPQRQQRHWLLLLHRHLRRLVARRARLSRLTAASPMAIPRRLIDSSTAA